MKIICLITISLLFTCISLNAQSAIGQSDSSIISNAKRRLIEDLNLTNGKADSVIAIQKSFKSSFEALNKDSSLTKAERIQKVQQLKSTLNKKIEMLIGNALAKKIEAHHHSLSEDAATID